MTVPLTRGTLQAILALFVVVACVSLAVSQGAQGPYDPARPPAFPPSPPDSLSAGQGAPPPPGSLPPAASGAPPQGELKSVQYDLPAGWSVVSFPFNRIVAVSGLTRMLLDYAGGVWQAMDPRTDLGSLDTGHAFLAYCDAPTTVTAWGEDNTERTCMLDLENGWNLVGCPFGREIPWSAVLLARSQTRKSLQEAATPDAEPGDSWISSRGFRTDGSASAFDLREPGQAMRPAEGQWVFAWHRTLLLVNPTSLPPCPEITAVTPDPLFPGALVTVRGSGFGPTPEELIFGGTQLPPQMLLSWADTLIELRLPPQVQSGPLVVSRDHVTSRPFPLVVQQPSSREAGGAIMGKVVSPSGGPLAGAQIIIDDCLSATAGADGLFTFPGLAPGRHTLNVSASGFREATGSLEVSEGGTRTVCIELSPITAYGALSAAAGLARGGASVSARKAEKMKGSLRIVADACDRGSTRLWVHRIEVDEVGRDCLHWSNYWDTDVGNTYQELVCDGAVVGETYRIKITWRGRSSGEETTGSWDRKLRTSDQSETFDSVY